MRQPEPAGVDQSPRVSQAGSVRESLQMLGGLSAFFVLLAGLILFVRFEPSAGFLPVRLDVDPGRFADRLHQAASGTEQHIGWLLGITVAFLAGSFVAILTRHQWAEDDTAASRVGAFSLTISAITTPFVLLLIAGSFVDEALLPAALMSFFAFFVIALLALYVGRFASMTLVERLAWLESEIERLRARGNSFSSTGPWWLNAMVSIALAVGVSAVCAVGVLATMGIRFEIVGAFAIALIVAAYAGAVALLAFALAVGARVAPDRYTRILLGSTALGAAGTSVLVLWLPDNGVEQLAAVALTIAIGVPTLSASLPSRFAQSRFTIAGAAGTAAAQLLERRARRLVSERDRLAREHSPFVAK